MEQARRQIIDDHSSEPALNEPAAEAPRPPATQDKVIRLAVAPKGETAEERTAKAFLTARDFAAALDTVHEAAQAMRSAEGRAREADGRTQTLAQRATEELKNAELRIIAAEGRARAAEARAEEAEKRALEADSWLRQILATITEELPVRRQI